MTSNAALNVCWLDVYWPAFVAVGIFCYVQAIRRDFKAWKRHKSIEDLFNQMEVLDDELTRKQIAYSRGFTWGSERE